MATKFSMLLIFSTVYLIYGKPTPQDSDEIPYCYKQKCPSGTIACQKVTKISSDGKNLISKINCLDGDGKYLKNFTTTTDNPFGDGVNFEGYSFAAVIHLDNQEGESSSTPQTVITVATKEKNYDPKSEVEDLLSK